jgi:glycerol-3-phosphate dehydrogenase (NAD(P)+)
LGMSSPEAAAHLNGVAEGVDTVRGALELAGLRGIEMPIAEQVDAVVHAGRPPLQAVAELMSRVQKDELTGLRA